MSVVAENTTVSKVTEPQVLTFNQIKFPVFLIDAEQRNLIGEAIVMAVLKQAQISGGYNACFGHGNKLEFLSKVNDALFSVTGTFN